MKRVVCALRSRQRWIFFFLTLVVASFCQTGAFGAAQLVNGRLWPCGVVPYVFDSNVTPADMDTFRSATGRLEAVSGLKFLERTLTNVEPNYLLVTKGLPVEGIGGHSFVGMRGGSQTVTVDFTNEWVIVHELGHAVGLVHEQQRTDRNKYVNIHLDRVFPVGNRDNFSTIGTGLGAYDFDSVMHYSFDQGALLPGILVTEPIADENGSPISFGSPKYQDLISRMGQRNRLSALDAAGLAQLYPSFAITVNISLAGGNGTVTSTAELTCSLNGTRFVPSSSLINCGTNGTGMCKAVLGNQLQLDLNESPDVQSAFQSWSGVDVDNGPQGASIIANNDRQVSAIFGPPPPPPAGNAGCWIWNSTAGGSGAWLWNCSSSPPPAGGTPPPQGCWHWDTSVGSQGGWVHDVCGGTGMNRTGLSSVTVTGTTSHDPNEKLGSQGIGTQQYLRRNQALRYAVFFSNLETATASAQEITVTDQLDLAKVEHASFSLGPVAFGNILISPPAGASAFSRIVDLRPGNNLLVKVEASLDSSTGLLTWRFTSLDPATGQPPLDPSAGFLPPGGEGSVFFTVLPKAGTPTNTQINNQATIVFDANAPIPTQTWFNTIDNEKPVSHVLALPAQSSTSIRLQWTGTDVGAGVQDFTVYVSDNGAPFVPFVTQSTATSAAFAGQPGHSYGFFSTARDFVGNVEDLKTTAEAVTTVVADAIPPTTVATVLPAPNANGWNNSNVTMNLTAIDNPGGSGVQQITFNATGAQPIASTNAAGSSASALTSTEGLTSFSFFATDLAANVEPVQTLTIKLDKTPPSITGSRAPTANANGWSNTDVTASFTCADALSGLAADSPPTPTLVSTEGANQQVTGACQDLAGNTASATVSGINIDKTPPNIAPSRTPAANSNGWNNTNVTVSFACADALSGLAPGSPPAASVLASEGVNQQVSGTCFDLAGNSASAAVSGINIDKTPPALSGLPATNCTLWPPNHKFVTVATISAADLLSGLASFSVTGTSNEPQNANDPDIIITGTGLGPRTVQLRADRLGTGTGRIYTINTTASDAAGNVVNSTSTCTVPHDQAP
jgi:hypothetical protein